MEVNIFYISFLRLVLSLRFWPFLASFSPILRNLRLADVWPFQLTNCLDGISNPLNKRFESVRLHCFQGSCELHLRSCHEICINGIFNTLSCSPTVDDTV